MNAELQHKITLNGIEYKAERLVDIYRDKCEDLWNYLTEAGYSTSTKEEYMDLITFRKELWKLLGTVIDSVA